MAANSKISGFSLGNPDLAYVVSRLCAAVREIKTNVNALNAQLDGDGGVTGIDYAANHDLSFDLPSSSEDTAKNEIIIPV
jgi:hypothetical protein